MKKSMKMMVALAVVAMTAVAGMAFATDKTEAKPCDCPCKCEHCMTAHAGKDAKPCDCATMHKDGKPCAEHCAKMADGKPCVHRIEKK